MNEHDVQFQTTARSARACTVYLSQNLPNYHAALGGEQKGKALTQSLLGCMATQIFCANSESTTNEHAANLFGKSWQQKSNAGVSHADKGGRTANAGSSESLEYIILPSEFSGLRTGGKINNYLVDTIIHGGGRTFRASGEQYLKTSFNQKG